MRKIILLNVLVGLCLMALQRKGFAQQNYYIDAVAGNDANLGSSENSAWQNLSKLYTLSVVAGSTINLKCGSVWTGQQLKFLGSGSSGKPIVVNQYGSGAKPILHGNGFSVADQGVVYLYNQKYIEINNLEITNDPAGPADNHFFVGLYNAAVTPNPNPTGGDRRGVTVVLKNLGLPLIGTNVASHIYLKNLYIHHIKGQLGSGETSVNGAVPKRTGGIYFTVLNETAGNNSRFDDVLIDSCTIAYCENIGVGFDNEDNIYYPGGASSSIAADVTEYNNWFARRYTKIKISNNTIHHIGKNAMIIRCADSTGLIERNVCYETAQGTTGNTMFTARCKGTVFQYNEGYYNRGTTQKVDAGTIDGSMYDADLGSVGVIFQYSYSHDNSEGLYWGCNCRGSSNNTTGIPDPGDKGCTLRYCVSKNDMGDLIFFNYPSAGNEIYNNVFYIKSGLKPNIIHESGTKEHGYNYYNNIVYNLSSSAGFALANSVGDRTQTRSLSNNVFYSSPSITIPTEMSHFPTMQTTDPQFLSLSSTVTLGINSLGGFKLKPTSPFIGTGKIIANNGGQDYYGTPLPATAPNRGVYEGAGTLVLPVVFSSFTLQSQNGPIALQWQTATEQNTQYFDIERSSNGTDFSSIGKQSAAGNSSLKTTYQFVDRLPFSGTNYYRLKQVDKNGAVQYSAIKILNSPRLLDFQVYPNPANNLLFIKTNLPSSLKWKGTILNVKGELVKEIFFANKLTDPIHIEQLSTGMYVLKIVDAITNTVVAQTPFLKF